MFINELDFKKIFIYVKVMQKNKILMEEFINGPQISAEAIVQQNLTFMWHIKS